MPYDVVRYAVVGLYFSPDVALISPARLRKSMAGQIWCTSFRCSLEFNGLDVILYIYISRMGRLLCVCGDIPMDNVHLSFFIISSLGALVFLDWHRP